MHCKSLQIPISNVMIDNATHKLNGAEVQRTLGVLLRVGDINILNFSIENNPFLKTK